ncbi:MAG: tetratricopeptide repeat protein [Gemmatimonadales bacterium]
MASTPETPPPELPAEDRAAALLARLKANRQLLIGVLVATALVVLIAWFMVESGRRKEAAAMQLLESGWSLQDQGNLPQASTEYQRVVDTYRGTDAAMQATLALNQVRMESEQAQLAVDGLREFLASSPPAPYAAAANRLLGLALEDAGEPAEAAAAFQNSADLADQDFLKAEALLAAGRAWRAAGNTEAAITALRRIVAEFAEAGVAAEATVRLAELTKGAME